MSIRWCGCDNYEICPSCIDNFEGDIDKEKSRIKSEKAEGRRKYISGIRNEILKLQSILRNFEEH